MNGFLFSVASTANIGAGVAFTAIAVILTFAVLFTAVWLLARFIGADKSENAVRYVVALVAAGVVLRFLTAFFIGGYRFDFAVYNRMIEHFLTNGVTNYYFKLGPEVYPLTFYVFALFGGLGRVFGIAADSAYLSVMIKIPFIIADAVTAVMLYKIGKKYINPQTGAVIAGVFSICPVFFTASGIWGTSLTLLLPFIAGSFYCLIEKKHFAAIMLYALSMLVAKEAIYIYPVYFVYYLYIFIRALVAAVKAKKPFGEIAKDANLSLAYKVPVYFVCAFLIKYVVSLPLIAVDMKGNPFTFVYELFLAPLSQLEYFSYNGLSVFNIFGYNGETVNVTFPSVIFAVCFALLITGIVCAVYFSKKNRAVLPLLAAYVFYTLATYFLDSSVMSLYPVVFLLLLAFAYIKDRRLLQVFFATSVLLTVNALSAMVNGGFMNMLSASSFVAPSYTGSPLMDAGFALGLNIALSVLAVATHIYLTLVTFDISMSNNRKLLCGREDIGYFEGIKKLFK